jgi:hypothetical protein
MGPSRLLSKSNHLGEANSFRSIFGGTTHSMQPGEFLALTILNSPAVSDVQRLVLGLVLLLGHKFRHGISGR